MNLRPFRTVYIFILLAFLYSGGAEARRCKNLMEDELAVIRELTQKGQFRTDRPLLSPPYGETERAANQAEVLGYDKLAGPEFISTLKKAAISKGLWVDIGMGDGQALADALVLPEFQDLRFAGIAPFSPDPVVAKWVEVEKVTGKRVKIRHETLADSAPKLKGKARVITDIYGALSYVSTFDRSLKQAINALEVNGDLFIALQRFMSGEKLYTRILDETGNMISLENYIKRIEGVELVWSGNTANRTRSFHIRRTGEKISVPKLKLEEMDWDRTPPERHYRIVN